jgi:hypothetical protein
MRGRAMQASRLTRIDRFLPNARTCFFSAGTGVEAGVVADPSGAIRPREARCRCPCCCCSHCRGRAAGRCAGTKACALWLGLIRQRTGKMKATTTTTTGTMAQRQPMQNPA